MRKKCIAIAKKAMVWTLAASMLVATPLTASAAGLRDVYSTSDGSGNTTPTGDPSRTGTVTSTNSNSTVLGETEARVIGLAINPSAVQLELKSEPARGKNQENISVEILTNGDLKEEELNALKSKLRWSVKNTDIASVDAKSSNRTEAKLTPWMGGKTKVEVTLDDYKENIHFKAEADVTVKEYLRKFDLVVPENAKLFVNRTFDLTKLVANKVPATATDTITFAIDPEVKNGATVNAANVVTFKKPGKVHVVAISEQGVTAEVDLDVQDAVKAKAVTIHKFVDNKVESAEYTKDTRDIANDEMRQVDVAAKLVSAVEGKVSTDAVTWTSNKPDIVEVVGATVTEAEEPTTLKLKKVGKATITAKASSGKSKKLNITVAATLKGLEVKEITACDDGSDIVYTGQSVQLEALRTPKENTEALKWNVSNKKVATINSKGVLTVKNTLPDGASEVEIKISVENKKNGDAKVKSPERTITVKQSKIKGFNVYEGSKANVSDPTPLITVDDKGKQTVKNKTSKLNVPQNKTYIATVAEDSTGDASILNWSSSNSKVASIEKLSNGKVKITPVKKGNATIKVSGVMEVPKGKKTQLKLVTASFKVAVTQPTTTLTLNKTNVFVKYKANKQNVAFSVKQNKDAKEAVTWSVTDVDGNKTDKARVNNPNKGTVELVKNMYEAGDVFKVTARSASGITASTTITVINESKTVKIAEELNESGVPVEYSYTGKKGTGSKEVKKATVLGVGDSLELVSYIETKAEVGKWKEAGTDKTAAVTYTANKKGVVQIIGNTVTRLKKGSVTITAKTGDGKTYKLKIDDTDKLYEQTSGN